jgi:hypothetical protein
MAFYSDRRHRTGLLLEQTFKRRPRIHGTRARGRRRLFLARHPHLVRWAFILRVFFRYALFHRLHALKPAPRIEIHALLARMQLKPALRTFPVARHPLQYRSALRATRHSPRSRQIHWLGPERVVPLRRTALALRWRLARLLTPRFTIVVLISRLPIFRHRTSPRCGCILLPILFYRKSAGAPSLSGSARSGDLSFSTDSPLTATIKP